jgi:transposase
VSDSTERGSNVADPDAVDPDAVDTGPPTAASAATAAAPILALDAVSVSFGAVRALRSVSLALAPGSVHALAGENGAGKSTLVKVLAGVLRPEAGRVLAADLAAAILALDERIKGIDRQITTVFRAHPQAKVIESMPGIGPILGAELVAAAGQFSSYRDDGHLASAAGLVPVPRDCGRRTGNLRRPVRYNRQLRRFFYLSAQTSIIRDGPNRDFYLKKRAQGLRHIQAVIALARRRVSVLCALLRDNRCFTPVPSAAQTA